MSKKRKKKDHNCSLCPYEVEPVISIQDAKQKAGWGISAFNLPEVWKHTKGAGVKIAVLDTGCALDHSDLKDGLLPGINLINSRKPPEDDNQHGTHVTGIICAKNNDTGMVGVAPEAKVIPVKCLDHRGNGDLRIIAKGVRWAADNGADIISMSLGAPVKLQQVRKAIQYAAKKGIPTFCAAGNAGNTEHIFYPSRYPETIAVGAINENFKRSRFSNTGKNLDFMAPGTKIFSTIPGNWYAILSGTSMACPFAVGVAALLLSYSRDSGNNVKLQSVDDYRKFFKKYTTSINDKKYGGEKFFQGFGIIDPREFTKWLVKK